MKNLIGRIFFFIGICMIGFGVLSAPKFMDVFYLCVIPGIILVVLCYKPAKRYGQWMKEVEIAGKEHRRKAANAVRAQIIGTGDKPSTISTCGRGVAGTAIGGVWGGVAGAATAKRKGYTKFLVEYEDGHRANETVKDNSLRYNQLIQLIEW